jgi:hypothetical protein
LSISSRRQGEREGRPDAPSHMAESTAPEVPASVQLERRQLRKR